VTKETLPEMQDKGEGRSRRVKKLPYEPREEYCTSPVQFADEVLGVEMWSKQVEILEALAHHRRVAVKSGNGLGKGFSAAVAILWFLCCHDPAVVLSTAPTFRQVRYVLWREVHKLYHRARFSLGGKLLDTRLEMPSNPPNPPLIKGGEGGFLSDVNGGRLALGLSADSGEEFQGFHSPNMLIVVDEAEGVEEAIYEAVESVMTSENCRLLLIGNPTTMSGTFRRAFHEDRELYHTITISALDSPNVLEGHTQIRGLVTRRWVEERKKVWGEDNPIYQARVLGEFPEQGEDTLIPLSLVEGAVALNPRPSPDSLLSPLAKGGLREVAEGQGEGDEPVVLAVDVARFGSDKSVVLRRQGMAVEEIRAYRGLDTMKVVGHVVDAVREALTPDPSLTGGGGEGRAPLEIVVDEVGIGAGVVDRLRELGYNVQGVNVGTPARDSEHYANLRAEGYWNLRQLFLYRSVSIPSDNELIGQLAGLRYTFDSLGRVAIEGKEEMRRRGVPSPDKADALMLAFLPHRRRVRLWG